MKKLLFLVLLILTCSHRAAAQSATNGNGAPGGSCSKGALYTDNQTGNVYSCNSSTGVGVWGLAGGGGSVLACTTTGGVAFENGTPNTLTCNPNAVYDPTQLALFTSCDVATASANAQTCFLGGVSGTVTGSTNNVGGAFGESLITVNTPNTTSGTYIGLYGKSTGAGSGTFSGVLTGFNSQGVYTGTGTATNLMGVLAQGNLNNGGGTVTNNYGIDGGDQHGVGSTLNAAFFAPDQGSGANDYALYITGGRANFGASAALAASGTPAAGTNTFTVTAPVGQAGTGSNIVGGTGNGISLISGQGGASTGNAVNSNGGIITFQTGAPGTGGSGTAGQYGKMGIDRLGGNVQIGITSQANFGELEVGCYGSGCNSRGTRMFDQAWIMPSAVDPTSVCNTTSMFCVLSDEGGGATTQEFALLTDASQHQDFLDFRDCDEVAQSCADSIYSESVTRLGLDYTGIMSFGARYTTTVPTLAAYNSSTLTVGQGLEVANQGSLASTSLTNGSTITAAKWSVTGDFAFSSNNAAFTFSSGVGTLTQTSGNLAIAIVPNALYAFTYTITGVSNTNFSKNPIMSITTGVAATALRLNSWANGTYTAYFYAAGSPGNFVINVSGASSGEAFTIGTLSLQQVNLGPLTVGAATASSLALTGSAPAITATGTTPYINASGPLEQRMQCSFNLTTSTLTTAASPVNLCTFTLPNAAVVWRVNCQGGWSNPAGTTPTFAVGNNWAQTPSAVAADANIGTTNAGVAVEGFTSATTNSNIVATGTLTNSATIFPVTWWTTFTGSATSGAYHPTASVTGTNATGTLVGFCTIQ